ncbi:MAG: serine hydrolase domain-containing protein [Bacteroidota bacterium]
MRRKALALLYGALLTILLINCKTESQQSGSQVAATALEHFTDSIVQQSIDSAQIAGAAILVHQNGKTLLKKSYGYASLELDVPMPENAGFEIGSVTKQFTAAAILKLAADGKLSLEDDFTKYLAYDTKGRKITIDQLLNHTSGIPSYTEMEAFGDFFMKALPRDSLVRTIEAAEFLFEPGEAMIYNNSAYFLLGLIIEKVSGKTYEEYLSETIFQPLEMQNTYYCSSSEVVKNKVYGYSFTPDGLKRKMYLNHLWPYAAGSLCSTTEDLLIWLEALHHQKILTPAQYAAMSTPKTLNNGTPLRYAMGLTSFSRYGHKELGHGGGIFGFLSDTRYFPEEELYLICLVNTTGPKGASFFTENISWELLDKQEYETQAVDFDLKAIEGTYSGQTRGGKGTWEINALEKGIRYKINNDTPDTLTVYLGNRTWADGISRITFKEDKVLMDRVSGYYTLHKQ